MRFKAGIAMIILTWIGGILGLGLEWTVANIHIGIIVGAGVGAVAGGILDGFRQEAKEIEKRFEKVEEDTHYAGGILQRLDRVEKKLDELKETKEK